jgi:hypothetical protein
VTFFLDENWITNDTVQLYTDASGAYGYGAVCGQSWFFGEWNAEWISENMTFTASLSPWLDKKGGVKMSDLKLPPDTQN